MGEFSFDNLRLSCGVQWALVVACAFVLLPLALFAIIRALYAEALTSNIAEVLEKLLLYAVLFGGAVSVATYLYGCYPKGTKSRLLFGALSGVIIIVYAFMIFVVSGLSTVLEEGVVPLDTRYFAAMLAFMSVPLFFSAGADYVLSRGKSSGKAGAASGRQERAR